MPCDTRWVEPEEIREAREALADLDALIATGKLRIVRDAQGRIAITGWEQTRASRAGWCDGCAVRALQASGSLSTQARIRDARLARAEYFAGHARSAQHGGMKDHKH
jgi:hypothetical protein